MTIPIDELRAQIDSPDPGKRMAALVALRAVSEEEATPILLKAGTDPVPLVRVYAAIGLGKKRGEGSYEFLLELLSGDKDASVRAEAAGSLGSFQEHNVVEPLIRAYYEDLDWIVRYSAVVSLGQLRDERGFTVLRSALTSETEMIREAAIGSLGELGNAGALDVILPLVGDPDPEVRRRVADALGKIGTPACRAPLSYLAKDDHPQVAEFARFHLQSFASDSTVAGDNPPSEHDDQQ